MGRSLTAKLAALPADDRALLADYAAALHRAGYSAAVFASKVRCSRDSEGGGASPLGNRLWAARQFLARWGLDGRQRLPAAEHLAVLAGPGRTARDTGYRLFAGWLALTGRLPFPPGLLETLEVSPGPGIRWLEHGRLAWPDLLDRLAAITRRLGYCPTTADDVCRAVAMAAAYAGKAPEALTLDELVALSDAMRERRARARAARGQRLAGHGYEHQPLNPWTTGTVLYHAGVLPAPPGTHLIGRRPGRGIAETQLGFLRDGWPALHDVSTRYLARRATTVRPTTVKQETIALGGFFRWLTAHHPEVAELAQLERRAHVEPYLRWVVDEGGPGRARGRGRWTVGTRRARLDCLRRVFRLLALWEWPEAPARPLLLPDDLPRQPEPLPKAFDDVDAARMVQLARSAPDPLQRLILELLAGCGLRVGEARDLRLSDVVAFSGAHGAAQPWLRVPLGKLGNDRYVPIGFELQAALDGFLAAERSTREWEDLPAPPAWTAYLLARKGRRVSAVYCNQVVQKIAARAGVADAHAHRWRHTFATQALNRGMDLVSISTLLGHTTLEMTMVYARIANPTLRREFERVSQQVQAFYGAVAADPPGPDAPVALPAGALGPAMVVARRELEWRRLGNGWCTRRAYLECRHELVCERCVHFNTDRLFLPVLEAQHADAVRKGQQARVDIFDRLVGSLKAGEQPGDPLPIVSGPRVADFSRSDADPKAGGPA